MSTRGCPTSRCRRSSTTSPRTKSAKTYFLIGSDYAFGRGMLGFTRSYIEKTGGKVLGEEYLPMDGTRLDADHLAS